MTKGPGLILGGLHENNRLRHGRNPNEIRGQSDETTYCHRGRYATDSSRNEDVGTQTGVKRLEKEALHFTSLNGGDSFETFYLRLGTFDTNSLQQERLKNMNIIPERVKPDYQLI